MSINTNTVVNVASVKHRSLFRYPGGKTWLVPHVRKWLASLSWRPSEFAEPFTGGGIVGLSVIFDNLADHLTLVELDDSVAAVWRVVLNGKARQLAERILSFDVSLESVRQILDANPRTIFDKAFATIIRNRMQRGGIMAPGASLMKSGEAGKGLKSRWYAETLARRIDDISTQKKNITFIHGDGVEFLRSKAKSKTAAFLIDPPYTVAGGRLYLHSELDHEELFRVAAHLKGDFLMTYDNTEQIRQLAAKHGFDTEPVSMKTTHHDLKKELLIGKNLDWARR